MVINGGSGDLELGGARDRWGYHGPRQPLTTADIHSTTDAEPLCIGDDAAAHRIFAIRCLHSRSELQLQYTVDSESRFLLRSEFTGAANVKLNPGIYYIDGVTCGSGHHASAPDIIQTVQQGHLRLLA